MLTFDLNFDIAKPYRQAIKVPANTPYVLRIKTTKNGQPIQLWGNSASKWDAIPVASEYQPQTEHERAGYTTWVNAPIDIPLYKTGILFDQEGAIGVEDNTILLACKAHAAGSDSVKFLVNNTDTSFELISTSNTPDNVSEYAMPFKTTSLELNITWGGCGVSLNPSVAGILLEGTYEDGGEFSFSIPGVENEVELGEEE